ncbi:MAG: amidohydrolase family protein, partial [Pseudomonadota bacterium]
MRSLFSLAVSAIALAASAAAADITVVHAGRLLAVPGEEPRGESTVVIADGVVSRVADGFLDPDALAGEGDDILVVDLNEMFVLPGLIDGHVHITFENNPNGRLQTVQLSAPDRALLGANYARVTLEAGFTTVRDVGAREEEAVFALRDAVAAGYVPGPRIFASGQTVSPTGGHADGTQGYRPMVAQILASGGVCDGTADCRRAVRERVKNGADHIKITATGGVLSNTAAGTEQQFFEDELEGIVEAATLMGRKVTAHAHGAAGIKAALRAGVSSIEHGTYLDDEAVRLFKRNGAYLVPTVLAGVTVAEWAADPDTFLTPPQQAKAAEVGPRMLDMLRKAHGAGVKIAFGTDSGVSAHGENARDRRRVDRLGRGHARLDHQLEL